MRLRKKQKKSGVSWLGVIALLLAVALLAGAGGYGGAYLFTRTHGKAPTAGEKTVLYQSVIRTVGDGEEEGGELTVSEVANIAAPSVVEIVTESVAYGTFFGQYTTSGAGSGVILSEDGLIVTNYHVIDGAKSIKVTLKNGEDYVGTLVGGDEQNDIALVRIEAEGLTPAVLGESASLVVGEGVVAVGNPLGELGGTVTDGIISALDREIEVGNASYTLLQTNAAVNPGNSGGGLFNMHGELIGIVNAKISENNVEGLGFAIPVDRAKGIIEELATYGYVRGRIDLGMQLIEINDAATAMYYNVTESGVYIVSVKDTTFGFAPGDLILSLDGKEILTMADLEEVVNAHKVGDSLAAKVKRRVSRKDFQTLDLTLVLGEEVPSFIH
ncbi:MAG: trypsin-like peptidase domain-containing protein [Clostridia bacterium]|nr:trypsin-like peptidase domain-containing protein [Clostridia bacterium]